MKLKKTLALLMASAMTLGMLAGCGGSDTPDSGTDAGTGTDGGNAGADGGLSITLVMSQRDEFLSTLEAGAKTAASELGVSLNTVDAQQDTSKMIQYVESARNAGDQAVIVNIIDNTTTQQIIEAAGDMKLVFVNRPPEDLSMLNENVVYVGSDENDSGRFQGEFLAEYFKAQNKTDIKYIMLNGIIGHNSTTLRTESALKALADNGINATEAAAPLACEFDRATAQDMIAPLLTTADYDCIISNNDAMALGAVEAMKAANLDPASIPIVGIDATVDGRQGVKDGTLAMTVFQDANGQGFGSVAAAKNMVEGKPIDEGTSFSVDETGFIVWVPFEPVTKDNVADYD